MKLFNLLLSQNALLILGSTLCNLSLALSQEIVAKGNVILFMLDDLDTVITKPFYKEVLPFTMEMAQSGVRFENSFVTTPICCPSRAAFLSGRYGYRTNVLTNGGPQGGREQFLDDEKYTFPVFLQKAGIDTFIAGKYMNGFEMAPNHKIPPLPPGWTDGNIFVDALLRSYTGYNFQLLNWQDGFSKDDQWISNNQVISNHGKSEKDYSTDVILEKTIQFLNRSKQRKNPFFAYIAPTCPHIPLPPAPRHHQMALDRWTYSTLPTLRPNYFSNKGKLGNLEDTPTWLSETWKKRSRLKNSFGKTMQLVGALPPKESPLFKMGWNETDWFNRMGSLYACDQLVEKVVAWLKDNNEWDNTLIIFTSDNGYNLGAHSLAHKMVPYEESLRVPLFAFGGKNLNIKQDQNISEWVLNIDLAPTILDFFNVKSSIDFDGRSIAPFIFKGYPFPSKFRDEFFIQYVGNALFNGILSEFPFVQHLLAPSMFLDIPSYKALRFKEKGKEYLFVRWEIYKKFEYELFDISSDPYQLDNLLYYYPEKYKELKQEVEKKFPL